MNSHSYMHRSFSVDGNETMTILDPEITSPLGQWVGLTFLYTHKIAAAYQCPMTSQERCPLGQKLFHR